MLAASGQDYLRLIGTEGALELPSLRRWRGDDWRLAMHPHDGPRFAAVDPLAVQLERFADLMDGAPDDVLCTGPEGRSAAAATLACALSATEARPVRPESVPDDYRGFGAEAPA